MIYSEEGFEEEQMSNLGCENVSDLIAEVKRLRDFIQSVWDGLGEAGRNKHYGLFKEYMGDD